MPKSKRKKRRSKSKTGFFGVVKQLNGKYRAEIYIDRKTKNLGASFDTAEQAAKAVDREAIKLRRLVSSLNFPNNAPVGYTPKQKALPSNNTVGYRGVYKKAKKFAARMVIGGKLTYLGTHETAKDAAVAYDRFVLKANLSTSFLNFPDMVHNLDVEPKRKKYTGSSSGYRGVSKVKRSGKFTARTSTNGKTNFIGTFETAIQAALAYDQAAIKKGVPKSRLNFPKGQKKQKKQEKQVKEKKQKKPKKKTKKKELLALQEYKEMLEIWNDME